MWAVLDSAGIAAEVTGVGGAWALLVHEHDVPRALRELEDYGREDVPAPPVPELVALGGGWIGAALYSMVIVVAMVIVDRDAFGLGRAVAGRIVDGEWWRAVTALTLHVDARHLLGNLLFGSVLGAFVAQGLGGGVAWFTILIGGALGNVANAFLHGPAHSAVGASTSVFAALGLLVALALHHNRRHHVGLARRWSPLVAGILLLGWTGVGGERTDVLAHVTGMIAGLSLGVAAGFVPRVWLERRTTQVTAFLLCGLILVGAWSRALG